MIGIAMSILSKLDVSCGSTRAGSKLYPLALWLRSEESSIEWEYSQVLLCQSNLLYWLVVIKDYECVRRRNFNTVILNDFPVWLTTSVYCWNQHFSINRQPGFYRKIFQWQSPCHSDWRVPGQLYCVIAPVSVNRTKIFTSAFKFSAKYSHIYL